MSMPAYAALDQPEILAALFHPRREPETARGQTMVQVADAIAIGAALHLAGKEAPTILFFHGNGETAADYDEIGPVFNRHGLNFIAADYRGYGASTGTPSVSAMMADALTLFRYFRDWLCAEGYAAPLFVMGRSLGSGAAIEIAASHQAEIAGLIIDSGFGPTLPLLLSLGIDAGGLGINEGNGFRNLQKIAGIMKPVYILHGQHDTLIPASQAEMLQVQCPSHAKQFQIVPGADHNSLILVAGERYFAAIKMFIDKTMKVRRRRSATERK
ncbi:MAG: alpha/beta hydrolase [Thermodesulfobacteriota bacterium]